MNLYNKGSCGSHCAAMKQDLLDAGYDVIVRYCLDPGLMLSTTRAVLSRQAFIRDVLRICLNPAGRVVIREFATPPQVSGWWAELAELFQQLAGLVTNNPTFTDNASVSLQQITPEGAGGRQMLLAMSETPAASYVVDPQNLQTVKQVWMFLVYTCVYSHSTMLQV